MHFKTPKQDWEWLRLNWQEWITPAAIVLLVILLVTIAIARRHRKKLTEEELQRQPDKWGRHVRVLVLPIILMWETQGVYELSSKRLHAPPGLAYVFCIMGSGLLIMFSLFAEGHHRRHGTFGPNGRAMRYAAAVMGFAVSTAATSVPEFMARLAVPFLAILGWRAALIPDEPPDAAAKTKKRRSRWIWTPSLIGTKMHLLIADEDDVVHDNRELRIRAMEKHAAGELAGMTKWSRDWHKRRLERLAARVTDLSEVVEVQKRRSTAVHIVELVRASAVPPALVSTVDDAGRPNSPQFANVLAGDVRPAGVPDGQAAPTAVDDGRGWIEHEPADDRRGRGDGWTRTPFDDGWTLTSPGSDSDRTVRPTPGTGSVPAEDERYRQHNDGGRYQPDAPVPAQNGWRSTASATEVPVPHVGYRTNGSVPVQGGWRSTGADREVPVPNDREVPVPHTGTTNGTVPAVGRAEVDTLMTRVAVAERDAHEVPVPASAEVPPHDDGAEVADGVEEDDTVEPAKSGRARAEQLWSDLLRQGVPLPNGTQLAQKVGVTDSLGRRWVREWTKDPANGTGTGTHDESY